jgi:DNA primase
MIDALTAVQWGWRACAILGAANAGPAVAKELTHRYPGRDLVLSFDDDPAGHAATERLMEGLDSGAASRLRTLTLPPGVGDINDWLRHGSQWPAAGVVPLELIGQLGAPLDCPTNLTSSP